MSKFNWINCTRIRKYEPASVVYVDCMHCGDEVRKSDACQAIARDKVKIVWCTECIAASEASVADRKLVTQAKKAMKENNQLNLFMEEGETK